MNCPDCGKQLKNQPIQKVRSKLKVDVVGQNWFCPKCNYEADE